LNHIKTFGELKASGYKSRTIKEELRQNLIRLLKDKKEVFKGIIGFEDTVIPDIQRAILSRHNIILLGLRGQAKTRIARMMVELLDEWMPIVAGSEMNDDPLKPISRFATDMIAEKGDDTPIGWVHRNDRYTEKLATPDVSVADLIGDADPIKAANLKLPYSDERVIHFGLVPRSHRCIFVINELPDLQPRIQVALFNILQEGDIQIRGFKLRLPLDIQFVFTANPEDYTNRGSIVTPLKDRIQSQILTHYPKTVKQSRHITKQEAKLHDDQHGMVRLHNLAEDLIEQISFEARGSEYVDSKSGVSARLTISAYENLVSAAERRALINGENETHVRIGDFLGVVPAITGKIELVYEGEQEGPAGVAQILVGKAIRTLFTQYFPDPERQKKKKEPNAYNPVLKWFTNGNLLDLNNDLPQEEYVALLKSVPGLEKLVNAFQPDAKDDELYFFMEFALHGLAEFSLISKSRLGIGMQFKDILSGMMGMEEEDDE
jgi:magnesium chelatase subunit I